MIRSVRGRLTIAVVVLVGGLAVAAASIAPRSVHHALVDDRLDAEVEAEVAALTSRVAVVDVGGQALAQRELTALFGPGIERLVGMLADTGALEQIREYGAAGDLQVVPVRGVVGTVAHDGAVRVESGAALADRGPVVTSARLEQLVVGMQVEGLFADPYELWADGRLELHDLLGALESELGLLDGPPFGGLERDGLFEPDGFDTFDPVDATAAMRSADDYVFGVRTIGSGGPLDGTEVIVAAPADGIDLTVGRVRTALWTAVPLAMLLAGGITWMLAGRALRPVRLITDRTRRIHGNTLHERVPVPASGDEIAGLATVMNDMLDRLQREDARRRQFVADASHELRSPIASIRVQAEAVLADGGDGGANVLAGGVLAEAERLGTIVADLLSLARHDEGEVPLGTPVDLDDLVLADARRPRRVPVDTSAVSAGRVTGRSDELARVVTHLLDNAARHARERVAVALATDDVVRLTVDDDGPGVPLDQRDRVFERFVRLDEARVRDAGGAGLGLAVVASVVAAAGGRVTVGDAPLGGARFEVTLPATE